MEHRAGVEPVPVEKGFHTFSAILCLDDQAFTEVMPESVESVYENGLPAPFQGYPTGHPLQRARLGGGTGWMMMWPSTHLAHRGVCPGKLFPICGDPEAAACLRTLPHQRSLSLSIFGAMTFLPNGAIDLENTVDTLPHQVRDMYGLPVRMVCFACREAILFEGSYEQLPRVYACQLCEHAIEGTELKQIGHVMCGSCHDLRQTLQPGMQVPLRIHALHPLHAAPLSTFQLMSPEEAKARAVVNFADVAMVCNKLRTTFGRDADISAEARARLKNLQFRLPRPAELQEQQPVDLSATPVQVSTVPDFHEHPIFKEMGLTCPTAQSVAFAVWVAARRTVPSSEPPHPVLQLLDDIAQRESPDMQPDVQSVMQHRAAESPDMQPDVQPDTSHRAAEAQRDPPDMQADMQPEVPHRAAETQQATPLDAAGKRKRRRKSSKKEARDAKRFRERLQRPKAPPPKAV
ncbi:hypothetical protein CYMTET_28299 [Cymbomonas tetramitiformis]|uniref:Uncharacterized protein n=1 Tax=Cymbomonas tetramitiformis TaxID=36881 RepID=A0AAE0KWB4_9CHLO|nr:hypothetical protein CYMTET_28299 [Cymbomonas tetramitiformis]